MTQFTLFTPIFIMLGAVSAQATPVTVFSTLELDAGFVINDGAAVDGLEIRGQVEPVSITGSLNSSVDAPDVEENESRFLQVGNPFLQPALPYRAVLTDATTLPGSPLEGAQGSFDIRSTRVANPNTFNTIEASFETEGSATILLATEPANSAGVSSYAISRGFSFENTTDGIISFSIEGQFEGLLSADVMGDAGLATTQLSYGLTFEDVDGVGVNYTELAAFGGTIDDVATGASVSQSFMADSSGFVFDAEAISNAADGGGLALSDGSASYRFSIQMRAGTSFILTHSFSQRNEATIRLQDPVTPVPLPASGLMLFAGMTALFGWSRRALS